MEPRIEQLLLGASQQQQMVAGLRIAAALQCHRELLAASLQADVSWPENQPGHWTYLAAEAVRGADQLVQELLARRPPGQ